MFNPLCIRVARAAVLAGLLAASAIGFQQMGTTVRSASDVPRDSAQNGSQRWDAVRTTLNSVARRKLFLLATQGEKTVDQVQKNIQVLKGLPAAQLGPLMNFVSASLGVRCNFCHVNKDGKWDFATDEKPEKLTAREMMKMVVGINKTNFKGATEVTCYTCHRGRTHPAGSVPLPVPFSPPAAPSPSPSPEAKETPPTAEQVLAKYLEALGGKAALDKIQSRMMKGTWLTSSGISMGYEVYQTGPEKLYMVLITPKQGNIERGFNGQAGWEKSMRGLRDIEGTELVYLRRYPDLYKDLKLDGQFTTLNFAGKDKIDDKEVYVLRGMRVDGKRERLYFDVQTGLLVRRVTSTPTMIAVIPEQVDFEDYRQVDGVKLPFTIRVSSIDPFYSSSRSYTEIKLNAPIDETKFNKPAAPPPAASPSPGQ